jgi:L-iditol 2-dehydrogenase
MACPGIEGSFAEYMTWPEEMCFKLPEGMDTIEGAMIEPLNVGLHTARMSEAKPGKTAAILGSGCIGLCTILSLRSSGVTEVYVIDVIEKRLNKAKALGATAAIDAKQTDGVKKVLELTGGRGTDIVVDAAGSLQTAQQTVALLKRGGIITLVGMSNEPLIPLDLAATLEKEGRVQTLFRYCNLYPAGINLVSSGVIPVKEIVTDYYNFNELQKGLNFNLDNKNDVVKIVIEFDD